MLHLAFMGSTRGIRTPIPRLARSRGLVRRPDLAGRALKFIVDHRTVDGTEAGSELARHGRHPLVELWTTSPFGPRCFFPRKPPAPGKLLLFDYFQGDSWGRGGVQNIQNYFMPIPRLEARGFPATQAVLEEAFCFYAAAEEFQADAIVTNGRLLLLRAIPEARLTNVSVLNPEEALTVVGLKLRSLAAVDLYSGAGGRLAIGLHECYGLLAHDAMPAAGRWLTECMHARKARLAELASAAFIRLRHALVARDHIQREMQFTDEPNFSDVLYHLDMFLLSFGGAFDSAAHVADAAHGLNTTARRVGWRQPEWLSSLGHVAPRLKACVDERSEGRAILDCLGALRNLIHSEVMGSWVFHEAGGTRRSFEIPDRQHSHGKRSRPVRDVVWDAAEAAGGAWQWGLERAAAGNVFLDPDIFIEELTVRGIDLLDDLLAETLFERISDIPLRPDAIPRPHSGRYRDEVHRTLAYLGGLAWPLEESRVDDPGRSGRRT